MIVRRLKRLFCDHKYEYVGMESVGASYGCDVLFHDEYYVRCVKCGKYVTAYNMAQVERLTSNGGAIK